MKLRDLGAGLAAALIGTMTPQGAPSPSLAMAHHTTRALKAWAPYLTPNEIGAAWGLIQSGLSFQDGTGIILIGTWANALGRSPRQVRRYAARFRKYGMLVSEPRFRKDHRPNGDVNRANWWSYPIPAFAQPVTEDLEVFLEATQGQEDGEAVAQFDDAPAPAPRPARQPPRTSPPPPPVRVAPVLTPDAKAVLDALTAITPYSSIANAEAAARIWDAACALKKNLAAVLQALQEGSIKTAGKIGAPLERFVIGCIERVEVAHKRKSQEEIERANADRLTRFREQDERAYLQRQARRLPPGTGPPRDDPPN